MGRNWSPKYKVECSWCFWSGMRTRRCLSNLCPKCRKSRTVEKFDPNKKYTDEEFARHRKGKLIDAGAHRIGEKWLCDKPRMCRDGEMKQLYEFDEYMHLYDLLFKESVAMLTSHARKRGEQSVRIGEVYISTER